jgi:hypothetical protein
VEIDLHDGAKAYGRVLEEPLVAFYATRTLDGEATPSLAEIAGWPVAFKIWVMNYAVTKGRWKVIGTLPLSPDLQAKPDFFKRDVMSGRLTIHDDNAPPHYERPATLAECEHLECAAVWEPEHVEDRLRDYFAGRSNRWVESLRIKPVVH